jgi:hypothetical protein
MVQGFAFVFLVLLLSFAAAQTTPADSPPPPPPPPTTTAPPPPPPPPAKTKCYYIPLGTVGTTNAEAPAYWNAVNLRRGGEASADGCYAAVYSWIRLDERVWYVSYNAGPCANVAKAANTAFAKDAADTDIAGKDFKVVYEECCTGADFCNRRNIPTTLKDPLDTGAVGTSTGGSTASGGAASGGATPAGTTPSDGTASTSSKKTLPIGAIIGIAIGGTVFLIASVLIVWRVFRAQSAVVQPKV